MVVAADGETVNSAEFVLKEDEVWFRIVATDWEGNKAYSNAYFVKELDKK